MVRKLVLFVAITLVPFSLPGSLLSLAIERPVEAATLGFGGNAIEILVSNPDTQAVTTRVEVEVELAGGGQQVLVSGNLTLQAGQATEVVLYASGTIVAIGDDPEPIPALP